MYIHSFRLIAPRKLLEATTHFQKAMAVYEMAFEAEPEMIEAKKQELLGTYTEAGMYLGKQLIKH